MYLYHYGYGTGKNNISNDNATATANAKEFDKLRKNALIFSDKSYPDEIIEAPRSFLVRYLRLFTA